MITIFVLIWALDGGGLSSGYATSGAAYFSSEAACGAAKAVLTEEFGNRGSYACVPDEQIGE